MYVLPVFEVRLAFDAVRELDAVPVYYRRAIEDAIRTQLTTEPTRMTRNRKPLVNLAVPWTSNQPVWELRVRSYRVFYDVDPVASVVVIRAIRLKGRGRSTEDIV